MNPSTTLEKSCYQSITVEKLTPLIGAEIGNVDLSQPLAPEQLDEILLRGAERAVREHRSRGTSSRCTRRALRRTERGVAPLGRLSAGDLPSGDVLAERGNTQAVEAEVRDKVAAVCARHPVYEAPVAAAPRETESAL